MEEAAPAHAQPGTRVVRVPCCMLCVYQSREAGLRRAPNLNKTPSSLYKVQKQPPTFYLAASTKSSQDLR